LLATASDVFARRCVAGLEVDRDKCRNNFGVEPFQLHHSSAPVIGYDKAGENCQRPPLKPNRTIREVAAEVSGLDKARLEELLDPAKQPSRAANEARPFSHFPPSTGAMGVSRNGNPA